jgi:hypothetical protein
MELAPSAADAVRLGFRMGMHATGLMYEQRGRIRDDDIAAQVALWVSSDPAWREMRAAARSIK